MSALCQEPTFEITFATINFRGHWLRGGRLSLGKIHWCNKQKGYCDEGPTSDTARHLDNSIASACRAARSLRPNLVRLRDRDANTASRVFLLFGPFLGGPGDALNAINRWVGFVRLNFTRAIDPSSMSALPPKADIGTQRGMSALCQERTLEVSLLTSICFGIDYWLECLDRRSTSAYFGRSHGYG
jgi:hypothetical protein